MLRDSRSGGRHLPRRGATKGAILDLCCGTGQLVARLSEDGYTATGVDGSESMIQGCRAAHRQHGTDHLRVARAQVDPHGPYSFRTLVRRRRNPGRATGCGLRRRPSVQRRRTDCRRLSHIRGSNVLRRATGEPVWGSVGFELPSREGFIVASNVSNADTPARASCLGWSAP